MSSKANSVKVIGLAAMAVGASLCVSGCADFARVISMAPEPVDPNSPVAQEVLQASRGDAGRPRFRDVPAVPTGTRPPAAFAAQIAASEVERDQLVAWVGANPPMVPVGGQDTEAFAEDQRARIPAGQRGAGLPPAGTDEFAERLRDLATPPPPPK